MTNRAELAKRLTHWATHRETYTLDEDGAFKAVRDLERCGEDCREAAAALSAGEGGAALGDIAIERQRQITTEGWTAEHDDTHTSGEMVCAACCYAMGRTRFGDAYGPEELWPSEWDYKWWKPGKYRRNLVKAGALIVAEVERIDRHPQPRKDGEAEAEKVARDCADIALRRLAPAQVSVNEEMLRKALKDHYLAGILCDHETKTDKPSCACSMWDCPPQPTIGQAVDRWIEHFLEAAAPARQIGEDNSNGV